MINRRTAIIGGVSGAALLPAKAWASTPKARIIVSLADNAHQGIVPIKASLGNGQDPRNNLYWGAMYGLKTYFQRLDGWNIETQATDNPYMLEKLLLWHRDYSHMEIYAEAWDGSAQRKTTESFMSTLKVPNNRMVVFVGHNPLMDIDVPMPIIEPRRLELNQVHKAKFAVIACQSKRYFEDRIKAAGHIPYVLTVGNMAPEAYVVEAIIRAWIEGGSAQTAREYAAKAYAKYQKIPLKNANWLFGV